MELEKKALELLDETYEKLSDEMRVIVSRKNSLKKEIDKLNQDFEKLDLIREKVIETKTLIEDYLKN